MAVSKKSESIIGDSAANPTKLKRKSPAINLKTPASPQLLHYHTITVAEPSTASNLITSCVILKQSRNLSFQRSCHQLLASPTRSVNATRNTPTEEDEGHLYQASSHHVLSPRSHLTNHSTAASTSLTLHNVNRSQAVAVHHARTRANHHKHPNKSKSLN